MKKNIDNKNLEEETNGSSLDGLSSEEIANKFDKQMAKLEKIEKEEAMEKNENPDDLLDKIDDFFDKWKEKFDEIDPLEEKNIVEKYANISDRNIDIQDAIKSSWNSVLDEIWDWKKEKNPVSRNLYRIANWILKTEK